MRNAPLGTIQRARVTQDVTVLIDEAYYFDLRAGEYNVVDYALDTWRVWLQTDNGGLRIAVPADAEWLEVVKREAA